MSVIVVDEISEAKKNREATLRSKQVFDRLAALCMLVPGLPIMWMLQLLIKLTSPGPTIYVQRRVGKDGKVFNLFKLRSMPIDAEAKTGATWSPGNADKRATWIGRIMRRMHLDELPQLYNVVRGEMSIVGPRPERPEFVPILAQAIPGYEQRLSVLPGITGLAQINLRPDRNLNCVRRKLIVDCEYIENLSLGLDMRILACTMLKVLFIPGWVAAGWFGLKRQPVLEGEGNETAFETPVPLQEVIAEFRRQQTPEAAALTPAVVSPPAAVADRQTRIDTHHIPTPQRHLPEKPVNAFTVDVEDYFQVTAFDEDISRSQWDNLPSRVVENTHRILELLGSRQVRGTFFMLGWVADRYPELVKEIHAAGHEIGSHGYWHRQIFRQSKSEFRSDLVQSRDLLEDIIGEPVTAFRAPTFSITESSQWALDVLVEEGFTVDSSIVPVRHDRYGIPGARKDLHQIRTPSGPIWEFPPSILQMGPAKLPVSGGGYFRLYPFAVNAWALRRANRHNLPFVFYTHPWEIDPGQPKVRAQSRMNRIRHYINLKSTYRKLERLLDSFQFDTISAVIARYQAADAQLSNNRAPEAVAT